MKQMEENASDAPQGYDRDITNKEQNRTDANEKVVGILHTGTRSKRFDNARDINPKLDSQQDFLQLLDYEGSLLPGSVSFHF